MTEEVNLATTAEKVPSKYIYHTTVAIFREEPEMPRVIADSEGYLAYTLKNGRTVRVIARANNMKGSVKGHSTPIHAIRFVNYRSNVAASASEKEFLVWVVTNDHGADADPTKHNLTVKVYFQLVDPMTVGNFAFFINAAVGMPDVLILYERKASVLESSKLIARFKGEPLQASLSADSRELRELPRATTTHTLCSINASGWFAFTSEPDLVMACTLRNRNTPAWAACEGDEVRGLQLLDTPNTDDPSILIASSKNKLFQWRLAGDAEPALLRTFTFGTSIVTILGSRDTFAVFNDEQQVALVEVRPGGTGAYRAGVYDMGMTVRPSSVCFSRTASCGCVLVDAQKHIELYQLSLQTAAPRDPAAASASAAASAVMAAAAAAAEKATPSSPVVAVVDPAIVAVAGTPASSPSATAGASSGTATVTSASSNNANANSNSNKNGNSVISNLMLQIQRGNVRAATGSPPSRSTPPQVARAAPSTVSPPKSASTPPAAVGAAGSADKPAAKPCAEESTKPSSTPSVSTPAEPTPSPVVPSAPAMTSAPVEKAAQRTPKPPSAAPADAAAPAPSSASGAAQTGTPAAANAAEPSNPSSQPPAQAPANVFAAFETARQKLQNAALPQVMDGLLASAAYQGDESVRQEMDGLQNVLQNIVQILQLTPDQITRDHDQLVNLALEAQMTELQNFVASGELTAAAAAPSTAPRSTPTAASPASNGASKESNEVFNSYAVVKLLAPIANDIATGVTHGIRDTLRMELDIAMHDAFGESVRESQKAILRKRLDESIRVASEFYANETRQRMEDFTKKELNEVFAQMNSTLNSLLHENSRLRASLDQIVNSGVLHEVTVLRAELQALKEATKAGTLGDAAGHGANPSSFQGARPSPETILSTSVAFLEQNRCADALSYILLAEQPSLTLQLIKQAKDENYANMISDDAVPDDTWSKILTQLCAPSTTEGVTEDVERVADLVFDVLSERDEMTTSKTAKAQQLMSDIRHFVARAKAQVANPEAQRTLKNLEKSIP